MAGPYQSSQSALQVVKEATRGTLNTDGTVFVIPVKTPMGTPDQKFIDDDAWRGAALTLFDQVQGVRNDTYEFKTAMYTDTFPVLALMALGGPDTVTGMGPYVHTIGFFNGLGAQPPSFSFLDFDGGNYFEYLWSQLDQLEVTWTAEGAIECTVKNLSKPYSDHTAAPDPFAEYSAVTSSEVSQIPGWDIGIAITEDDTTTTYVNFSEGTITLNRKTEAIFTSQEDDNGPMALFAGPLDVTGKFKGVIVTQEDPLTTTEGGDWALQRFQVALAITFTNPVDASNVVFTMSQVQLQDVKRDRGKIYTTFECNFKAQGNVTDGAASGTNYASCVCVVTNSVEDAY